MDRILYPMNPHELGRSGEALAAEYLMAHGWTIVERNYRCGRKEIDLIARQGDSVAFIEVKTRKTCGFGHPLEALTASKRREIETVARCWIARHGSPGLEYRFDAIAVLWPESGKPAITHLKDAW